MKAYRIDAEAGRISNVEVDDHLDILRHVGCDCFAVGLVLDNRDTLYIDDEGLLKPEVTHGFAFDGVPFVGNGLLVGGDGFGDAADVETEELEVAKRVSFR